MLNFPIFRGTAGGSGGTITVGNFSRFPWTDPPNVRGDMNFDGVTDFDTMYGQEIQPSVTRSGSVYTISAPIFAGAITIAAGVTVLARGCPFNATSITVAGTISAIGNDGGPDGAGGDGATSAQSNVDGYPGGSGGAEGAGGAYGPDNNIQLYGGEGGTGGLSTDGVGSATNDPTWNIPQAWFTRTDNQGFGGLGPYWKTWCPGAFDGGFYGGGPGGGGGGPTSGLSTARGGGGGGGGGGVILLASSIIIESTGVLSVQGGSGSAGQSDGGGAGGGGGGGGGGMIYLEYQSYANSGTIIVSGGSGGPAGGAGATAGATGNDGVLIQVPRE